MHADDLSAYLDAQRFYFLAEQSLNIIQKSLSKVLREYDLSHSQHLILLILRYAEFSGNEVISTDIAYLLGLEKHSITTVVDKLVTRELVARDRSERDRRVVHLSLTSQGRELAAAVHAQTIGSISLVPEHAQEEFAHMCDFLTTLRGHIAHESGEPAAAYDRAYQRLLLDGQAAFARESEQADPAPVDRP